MPTNQPTPNTDSVDAEELRDQISKIHGRLHGRLITHKQVAEQSQWSPEELQHVQIEDEYIFIEEILQLLTQARTNMESNSSIDSLHSSGHRDSGVDIGTLDDLWQPSISNLELDEHQGKDRPVIYLDDAKALFELLLAQARKGYEAEWEDMLDRAAAGEVVQIKRNGVELTINSMDGMHDGMGRIVETAMSLGREVERINADKPAISAGKLYTQAEVDQKVAEAATRAEEVTLHKVADVLSWYVSQGALEPKTIDVEQIMERLRTNPHTPPQVTDKNVGDPPQDTGLEIHDVSAKPKKIEGVSPEVIRKNLSQPKGSHVIGVDPPQEQK